MRGTPVRVFSIACLALDSCNSTLDRLAPAHVSAIELVSAASHLYGTDHSANILKSRESPSQIPFSKVRFNVGRPVTYEW